MKLQNFLPGSFHLDIIAPEAIEVDFTYQRTTYTALCSSPIPRSVPANWLSLSFFLTDGYIDVYSGLAPRFCKTYGANH
jgi:hypothetical protein